MNTWLVTSRHLVVTGQRENGVHLCVYCMLCVSVSIVMTCKSLKNTLQSCLEKQMVHLYQSRLESSNNIHASLKHLFHSPEKVLIYRYTSLALRGQIKCSHLFAIDPNKINQCRVYYCNTNLVYCFRDMNTKRNQLLLKFWCASDAIVPKSR